ncbi:hypothetical protein [Streptomyces sp. NPDC048106]
MVTPNRFLYDTYVYSGTFVMPTCGMKKSGSVLSNTTAWNGVGCSGSR